MMAGRTLLSVVFVWILLFGTVHKAETGVAASSSAEPCDLSMWYLDKVLDGAFSGELTREQSGIKMRIESLIAKTRDTATPGLISCSTLAAFDNILSQGGSPQTQGGWKAQDEDSSDEHLRGHEGSCEPSLKRPKESAHDGDHTLFKGEEGADSETNEQNTHGQKDNEDGHVRDDERDGDNSKREEESSRLEHQADSEADEEKVPEENVDTNTSDRSRKLDTEDANQNKEMESSGVQHNTDAENTDTESDVAIDNKVDGDGAGGTLTYQLHDDDDDDQEKNKDEVDVNDDGKDSEQNSAEKEQESSDGDRQNEQSADDQDINDSMSDSRQDQRKTQNTEDQRTSNQECTVTPIVQCRDAIQTSRWLHYMFQPFLPSSIHALTSPSFNIFAKCKTSAGPKRSKRRPRVSSICCHYYNILANGRSRRNRNDSLRITVAHLIKKSCRLAQQCSWQCLYGMLKQQCLQHYDLDINTSQPLSTKDDVDQNSSRETDDAMTPNSEAESDETEPQELDEKETNRNELQEERAAESHGTDVNPDGDGNKKELLKDHEDTFFDETEVNGDLPGERQAKQPDDEEVFADKNAHDHSRDTFDSRSEKEDASYKTRQIPEREKAKNVNSNPHENLEHGHEDDRPPRLSEAELLKIETMLQHKALEQAAKIQSLELLIMRLENHILSQKLNEQNGSSHLVYLENQILRIENELLKLNQSYIALQAENDILKSRQNKYLALEHDSKEGNKQISLPSNASDYFQLVSVQQEKITLLNELLNNQSSALRQLQSKSEQLEEQNQMLYQIILNQTALISHVMHKLQEVSEQTMKNQQETNHLKSVMDLHSVSSNIINKLERVLNRDSSNAGNPSDRNVPSQQSSRQADSNSSRQQGQNVLEFLQKVPEYSSKLQQWKCGNEENPRLCLYSSVMVSACPPFRTLSWGRCQQTIFSTGSTKDAKQQRTHHGDSLNEQEQIPGISSETLSTESHTIKIQSVSGQAQNDDAYQKNEHSQNEDLSNTLLNAGQSLHKTEQQTDENEEVPDSVEIPNVKSVSGDSEAKRETPDQHADSSRDKLHVSDMLPTPVTAEDSKEPDTASSQQEDETKRSESDTHGLESKGQEKENAKDKTLKLGTNENPAKASSDSTGTSHQKEESTGTHQHTVDKLVGKGTQSPGPTTPPQASDLIKQQTEEKTADVKTEAQKTASPEKERSKDGVTPEEKKRKEEAEKAKRLKKEAEAMQKRIQDADIRRPAYWSADSRKPKDCYDLYKRAPGGQARNGAYKVFVKGLGLYVSVFCDMKAGGWTLLMKREDGSLDFYRDWEGYRDGFGTPFGEHYLGNEVIHYLSNQDQYSLQVDLQDWQGDSRTASYRHFWIDEEEHKFQLHVLGYSGTAGDGLAKHDGMPFSTKDRDHDLLGPDQMGGSCARRFQGAGWYYKCYLSNLMGVHYDNGVVPEKRFDGIAWKPWTGPSYSLKEVVLKVRPRLAE